MEAECKSLRNRDSRKQEVAARYFNGVYRRRCVHEYNERDVYKRHLTAKLRNHKFRAGLSIPTYLHELRSLVKEAYDFTNPDAVDQIGNHILTNLDDSLKKGTYFTVSA